MRIQRFQVTGTPLPPPLTFLPMNLLTGFMRKEETKPLRHITSGMVAMNFCRGEHSRGRGMGCKPLRGPTVSHPMTMACQGPAPVAHLRQVEGIGEVHGDVAL